MSLDAMSLITLFFAILTTVTVYYKREQLFTDGSLAVYLLPWLAHSVVFYVVLLLDSLGISDCPVSLHMWSKTLRIHLYLTIILYAYLGERIEAWTSTLKH